MPGSSVVLASLSECQAIRGWIHLIEDLAVEPVRHYAGTGPSGVFCTIRRYVKASRSTCGPF